MGVDHESELFTKWLFRGSYRNTKANFLWRDGCRGGRAVLRSDISLEMEYIWSFRGTDDALIGGKRISIWHTARPWTPQLRSTEYLHCCKASCKEEKSQILSGRTFERRKSGSVRSNDLR